MKRGTPLKRTQIRRRAPLGRRAVRAKLTRATPEGETYAALRLLVWERAGGRCDCCGLAVPREAFEAHHRKLRSRGGPDTFSNLVCLSLSCHRWIHLHPTEATWAGFMLPATADPDTSPILRHARWWQQPTSDGYTPTEPPEDS